MSDNTQLNAGAGGDVIATDDIAGVKYQRVKMVFGGDGSVTEVSPVNPLPISHFLLSSGTINRIIYAFLDTSGNGTGLVNATGNYAATFTDFKILPSSSQVFRINKLTVFIQDSGTFDANSYGIDNPLTSGIYIQIRNTGGSLIQDLTNNVPVRSNLEWGRYSNNVIYNSWGIGDAFLTAELDFTKGGTNVRLEGASGEFLTARLNDNFSSLKAHYFRVDGLYENELT